MPTWDELQQRGRCCSTAYGKPSETAVAAGLGRVCFILPLTTPLHGSLPPLAWTFFAS